MKIIIILATMLVSVFSFAADDTQKPIVREKVDFGLVPHGSSRTRIFTLANNSTEPLTIISAKITGDFDIRHKCPQVLEPSESCMANIIFWADREGYSRGRLTVKTSAKDYIYDLVGYGEQDPANQFPPRPPRPPIPPRP